MSSFRLKYLNSVPSAQSASRTISWRCGHIPKPEAAVHFDLHFRGVSDEEMDPSTLKARQQRERKSLEILKGLTERLTTLKDFHRWLFTEHTAYKSSANAFNERKITDDLLRSY